MKYYFKRLTAVFCLCALLACLCTGCRQSSSDLTTVTLNEVAHSIFYAPQYVAIELGYLRRKALILIWSPASVRIRP